MRKLGVLLIFLSLAMSMALPTAYSTPGDPLPKALREVLDSAPSDYPFGDATKHSGCKVHDGLPDPKCTPGNVNPELTAAVICDADFRTGDFRNHETSETEKKKTYGFYDHPVPANNTGKNQKTELDHLVALTDGGGDDLSNIWPQDEPGFRDKDKVEVWIHKTLCSEFKTNPSMAERDLRKFQIIEATNWKKFLAFAKPKPTKKVEQISD